MKTTTQQTAADLSHQIRNRLTYIMLSSHTLRFELEEFLAQEQRSEFGKIDAAAKEIRGILDNLVGLVLAEVAGTRFKEEHPDFLIGG